MRQILIGLVSAIAIAPPAIAQQNLQVLVQRVQGTAVVNVAPFQPLIQGKPMNLPASAQTRKSSTVTYQLPLRVGNITQYQCTNLKFDELKLTGGALVGKTTIRPAALCGNQQKGFISWSLRKFTNNKSQYSIIDAQGRLISVTGTEFAYLADGDRAIIGVKSGEVKAGCGGNVVAIAANQYSISPGRNQPFSPPQPLPRLSYELYSSVGSKLQYKTQPYVQVFDQQGEQISDRGYFWLEPGQRVTLVNINGETLNLVARLRRV